MMTDNYKHNIAKALIKFGQVLENLNSKKEIFFTRNPNAEQLIWNNPLAFFLAVLLDQGMKAEKAWEIPYLLKQRLGHLDVFKIASISDEEIISVFMEAPKLHRFPRRMALFVKKACQHIIEKYNGKVENIWNDKPESNELHQRFLEFQGIGQKKASMGTNMLVRDFKIEIKDKRGIDVSYDIQVRRIFLRTGLVYRDDMNLILQTARELNPEYPGILDFPCWIIGRKYCHPQNPECNKCPISNVCLKLLDKNLPEAY
ncbi:MAG: endonuclease III [Ignavibacteria bacterium]|nr:endonuclease III [Ignavibacteria bacterium]